MLKRNKKVTNATICESNGITFRSKLEYNISKALELCGLPYHYEERKFILQESFKYKEDTIRAITYTPDFIVDNVIIECKGFPTDSWKIKRKLFLNALSTKYKQYNYIEVYSVKDLLDFIDMNNYFLHYNILVKDLKDNFVGEFNSLSEAVEALSIPISTKSNIRSCLLGNRSKAYGYIWERKETEFTPLVNEEWKDVVGFEHLYAVSSLGRIASKQFHGKYDFRVLKQTDIDGYKFVKLRDWYNGIVGSYSVHRLVAMAFLPNPENKKEVDHLDTNPSNNSVSNLKWTTHLENQRNPITNKRLKDSIITMNKLGVGPKISAIKKRKRVQYFKDNKSVVYESLTEAAKNLKVSISTIKRWCDNNINNCKYAEECNTEIDRGS